MQCPTSSLFNFPLRRGGATMWKLDRQRKGQRRAIRLAGWVHEGLAGKALTSHVLFDTDLSALISQQKLCILALCPRLVAVLFPRGCVGATSDPFLDPVVHGHLSQIQTTAWLSCYLFSPLLTLSLCFRENSDSHSGAIQNPQSWCLMTPLGIFIFLKQT